jgi:Flp pilus assembly pilin Flp
MAHFARAISNQNGASLVEVTLIAALIAVVCLPSLSFLGTESARNFRDVGIGIANTPAGSRIETGDDTFILMEDNGDIIECWSTGCVAKGGGEAGGL